MVILQRSEDARIASRDNLDDLFGFFLVELLLQVLVAEPLAPELLRFIEIFWARQRAPVDCKAFVGVELELFRLQQFQDIIKLLLKALQKAEKNYATRGRIAFLACQLIQRIAVNLELFEIRLEKINMQIVQGIEIAVEKLGGNLIIELLP